MKKYSKALATIPGGVIGITLAEVFQPIFYDALSGVVSPVEPWVLVAQSVVIIVVVGASVYASPKNEG